MKFNRELFSVLIDEWAVDHDCKVVFKENPTEMHVTITMIYAGKENTFHYDPIEEDILVKLNEEFVKLKEQNKDAGQEWYDSIHANPDIKDPMAAYEKIDAENMPDICPYCNIGGDNMKNVAEITDGELHASCWVDVDWKTQDPIMFIDISILDGISAKYDTQIKFGSNKINFCPMCGRNLKEVK